MRPLTVITGIVLGSCLSITVSLLAVLIMFLVLGHDYPRLSVEFPAMRASVALFSGMTAVSALSFYTHVIRHKWRVPAQLLMWASLVGVGWYYWP
ncbi:MAG TPA: hypothetical protein VE175_13305 [Woeseiaceae bacterium]|jgi:hypothetical protein|nr:hypothetical protein [Woeseiaceae bacterium]